MTNSLDKCGENCRKPLIGIVPALDEKAANLNLTYINAITASGALPILLCPTADDHDLDYLAGLIDGLLFTGGIDVCPEFYGDSVIHEKTVTCKKRDLFELAVFNAFYKTKKPIMGICRGVQFINVALGGTLFQDIPNHAGVTHHTNVSGRLLELAESLGIDPADLKANSTHHQALKDLGSGLSVLARADDNTIEAVCDFSEGRYLLGVQFHPEKSFPDDEFSRAIIKDFITACLA